MRSVKMGICLTAALMVSAMGLTGCYNNTTNNPKAKSVQEARPLKPYSTVDPLTRPLAATQNYDRMMWSQKAADALTKVPGVKSAYVIHAMDRAYVAVTLSHTGTTGTHSAPGVTHRNGVTPHSTHSYSVNNGTMMPQGTTNPLTATPNRMNPTTDSLHGPSGAGAIRSGNYQAGNYRGTNYGPLNGYNEMRSNGTGLGTGIGLNGTGMNGTGMNGTGLNGTGLNGTGLNGTTMHRTGMHRNNMNGAGIQSLYTNPSTNRDIAITNEMKARITRVVKRVIPNVKQVYVSANPDFVSRVEGYSTRFTAGHPITGIGAEFAALVNRIFPTNVSNHTVDNTLNNNTVTPRSYAPPMSGTDGVNGYRSNNMNNNMGNMMR